MLVRGLTVLVYDWSDDWSTNELILKVTQQNRRLQFEYYNRLPNRTKDRSHVTYYYKIKKNKMSESFPHFHEPPSYLPTCYCSFPHCREYIIWNQKSYFYSIHYYWYDSINLNIWIWAFLHKMNDLLGMYLKFALYAWLYFSIFISGKHLF